VLAGDSDGPKDLRRFTLVPGATVDVSFRFLRDQYSAFVKWLKVDLKRGLRWFMLPLPSAAGITPHVVRFKGRPQGSMGGHRYWEVTAEIEIRERRYAPLTNVVFSEDFENGISDWQTNVGGANSTAFFSIQPSPYGSQALFGAKVTAFSAASDRRRKFYFADEEPFNRFQCKGMMPTGGNANDDSPSIAVINAAGTGVFAMQISREVSYDAQQRPVFNLGGESLFPGTVRIPYDVWMEFNIAVNPGAGQSTYFIRRLDTGDLWASGTFANDHGSYKLCAGLQIYSEASADFTSQAGYIDDLICYTE